MSSRTAEVKGYVMPDIKSRAIELYAHWGMSLSDAINTFLIKSLLRLAPQSILLL